MATGPAQGSSKRQARIVAAIAGALALAIALVVLSSSVPKQAQQPSAAPQEPPTAPASPSSTARPRPARVVPVSKPLAGVELSPAERLKLALADYRAVSAYPSWSRPHDEGTAYKLSWNEPIVDDLPFVDEGDDPLTYRFAADRAHVFPGEAITLSIEVARAKARVPLAIEEAFIMVEGAGRGVPLPFHDDGDDGDAVAGDGLWTARFVPTAHPALATAKAVHALAVVSAAGQRRSMIRQFTYAPRPVVVVHGAEDDVVAGSLEVSLDVEVLEGGRYTFEANLLSGDGRVAIAYVDTTLDLGQGRARVPLVFFGKALRDAGEPGPYRLADLRGFKRAMPGSGGEANVWFSDPQIRTTRAWRVDQFSPAEWDSVEKREKIARLEALIGDAEKAPTASAPARPSHIHVGPDGKESVVASGP